MFDGRGLFGANVFKNTARYTVMLSLSLSSSSSSLSLSAVHHRHRDYHMTVHPSIPRWPSLPLPFFSLQALFVSR